MEGMTTPRMHNPFRYKLSEHQILLLLSLAVGLCTGLAAVCLDFLIETIKSLLNSEFKDGEYYWQYLLLPGIGMLISLLFLKYVIRDNIGHGVTRVLTAVSRNESRIKPHNMWSSIAGSAITIGFGGSVGAEAPIVYTGAAIGSNFGRWAGLSYRNVTILIGCGAAGAIAGIFKAPLAGVLFTMEILLFNVSMSSLLPLLLSTVSAVVISYIFRGQTPVFACDLTDFSMRNIPFYLVLGAVGGFASLYFTKMTLFLEDKLSGCSNKYLLWLGASLAIGFLIFLFPPLYGEGYESVTALLTNREVVIEDRTVLSFLMDYSWGIPLFFALIFFFKVIAMTLTNSGGGVGGTFGPTLFAGAIVGFVLARSLNIAGAGVPEQNFVLVGMAALMAGVMQAPMTAIFLIAEISGGYQLLIPLILSSTISFATVRIFEKYSIYTKRIAQSGDLLTHDSDQAVLTLLRTKDLIRDKYPRLNINASLGDIMTVVSESTAAVFPVLDDDGRFQGILEMDDIRKHMFDKAGYDRIFVYNIMCQPLEYVFEDEKMDSVLEKFEKTDAWRLPVLSSNGKYLGFISKSRILSAYRDELREISLQD